MNTLRLALSALLLAVSQLSLAVQPTGSIAPGRGPGQADIIERGGTVEAVDVKKQAIVVDGISYAIPAGSVRIHSLTNHISGLLSELKVGMQIRFSSSKDHASNQTQVREIWVTGLGGRPARP